MTGLAARRKAAACMVVAAAAAACGDGDNASPASGTGTPAVTAEETPSVPTAGPATTRPPPAPGIFPGTLAWDGRERSYQVHVPAGLDGSPVPLVVLLHGGGGQGDRIAAFTGFDVLGRDERFLVVAPDGTGGNWNDGRETDATLAHREQVDDVGFLRALVDELAGRLPVDRGQVYAAGISNGAFMSARLACEAADVFSAVGLVAGTAAVPVLAGCAPEDPVRMIGFFGTADPLVPYEGGGVRDLQGRPNRGEIVGVEHLAEARAALGACDAAPPEQARPDADPADGSTAGLRRWSGCREGGEVEVYRIEGGGHTWPGRAQYAPAEVIGTVNRDIDATALMWRFFTAGR